MIKHIVTAILSHKNKILIVKRSQKVKTFPGKWSGISGSLEKCDLNPYERAIIEINEETSIIINNLTLVKSIPEIDISDNTGIYLTYGQSNSVNSGELGYMVKNDVYQFILGNTFDYIDPSLGGTGYGGSVWGMLGDKLIKQGFHDKVIFSNSGWGGTNIEQLKKG